MSDFNALRRRDRNRAAASNAALPFQLVDLRKDGQPSGMRDAREGFATREAALARVASRRGMNPGRTLRFALNGEEV